MTATSRPASAASNARIGDAIGRRWWPSSPSTPNGGIECSPARWRASEAARSRSSRLAERARDHAPDRHRPRPCERLGRDAAAGHDDRAGAAHVQGGVAQLPVDEAGDVEVAARRLPAGDGSGDRDPGHLHADPDAVGRIHDDAARGRLDLLVALAGGGAPAPVHLIQERSGDTPGTFAARGLAAAIVSADPPLARRRRAAPFLLQVPEARVGRSSAVAVPGPAQPADLDELRVGRPLCDRRPGGHRLAGAHERAIARGKFGSG